MTFKDIYHYIIISRSGIFDRGFYLLTNPDVRKADIDPLKHFITKGWREGRNPSEFFDIKYYLSFFKDTNKLSLNPFIQYLKPTRKSRLNAKQINQSNNQLPHNNFENPLEKESAIHNENSDQPIIIEHENLDHVIENYINKLKKPLFIPNLIKKDQTISVVITTYNHEKYIKQCIDSVLMQKGNFNLEIIIRDDCSTDKTAFLINQYASENLGKIKVLDSEKNLGATLNLQKCLYATTGSYIAICEGDDFWIDQFKLYKQMNLLESSQDLSMCFSLLLLLYNDKIIMPHETSKLLNKNKIGTKDLIENNYIGNFSCCMYKRTTIDQLPSTMFNICTADWMLNMYCGTIGNIGLIREFMSVYRLHSSGSWTGKTNAEKENLLHLLVYEYDRILKYKYHSDFQKYMHKKIS